MQSCGERIVDVNTTTTLDLNAYLHVDLHVGLKANQNADFSGNIKQCIKKVLMY